MRARRGEAYGVTLGKALGGGLIPVSLFLARREVIDVFEPGDHGSTFGGNPIAAALGLAALDTLVQERLVAEGRCARPPPAVAACWDQKLSCARSARPRAFRRHRTRREEYPGSIVVEKLLRVGILMRKPKGTPFA